MDSPAFSSGLLISILVSPFWNFTDNPSSIARYAYRSVGKSNNSPTAVKHEPSIMPIGGTKKPPTISPTETKKQMANVMRDMRNVRGSSAFSFLITLAVRVIIVFSFRAFCLSGFTTFVWFVFSWKSVCVRLCDLWKGHNNPWRNRATHKRF